MGMPSRPRRPRPAAVVGVCLGLAAALQASGARASPEQEALAQQLFEEARKLVAARSYAEACDKFAESQRLAPAPGTLANLSVCHETTGKTATAWIEMKQVDAEDRAAGNTSRRGMIAQHLASLEQKLSRVVVQVDPSLSDEAELVVTIDGVALGKAAWGSAMPLDPGSHVVAATAPGKKRFEASVVLGATADTRTVVVGPLAELDAIPPPPTPPAPGRPLPALAESPARRDTRLLGGVTAGLGAVGLGVGSYFGLKALSDRNASNALCTPGCTQHAVDLNGDAIAESWASTIGFGVGIVGLAAGAYLFLTSPRSGAPRSQSVQLEPWSEAHASGVRVQGGF